MPEVKEKVKAFSMLTKSTILFHPRTTGQPFTTFKVDKGRITAVKDLESLAT